MGGRVRISVSLLAVLLALIVGSLPAAAETYAVSAYPYSVTKTLGATEEFDSHEITAGVGKEISYTARATGGGCILVLLILGHNVNADSTYLIAYSKETCVTSFSKSYVVPSGGGPDFSIAITTELEGSVAYQLDINVGTPSPWGAVAGIVVFIVIIAAIAGISTMVRRRKRAAPLPMSYPPPYIPGSTEMPPPAPPASPPMQPGPPPPPG